MPKLIITEAQYRTIKATIKVQLRENTAKLDPKSQQIVNDILGSLNESEEGIMAKVKDYAKKGLITATVLSALMAAPQLTNAQKQQVNSIVRVSYSSETTDNLQKTDTSTVLSTQDMDSWNNYILWLKQQGLSGDKRMNNVQFSKNTMDRFKKENPQTTMDYSKVMKVQKAIRRYRDWSIDIFKNHPNEGQPSAAVKKDLSNYMQWVLKTGDDGIAGEYTSQFMFPKKYMLDMNKNKLSMNGYADPMVKK